MSKSNAFETAWLEHLFNNANIANIGDATGLRGSTVAGNLYLALHTADPGEAGTQATNEATYGSYARAAVPRSAGGFTVAGNQVTLAADVAFPEGTSGSESLTHWSVGVASAGATMILYKGALNAAIPAGPGVIPEMTTGTTITED